MEAMQSPPPDTQDSVKYLIDRNGMRMGPYSLEEVRRYLGQGLLVPTDLAWSEGMPSWVQVSEVVPGSVPPPTAGAPPRTEEIIYCRTCGHQNRNADFKCVRCGALLHPPSPALVASDNTLGGLIPYKNAQSLWAYYLAIFALVPCLGAPLAVAALVLG